MNYKYFVGIDVSKKTLDYSILSEGKEILHTQLKNSIDGLEQFLKKLSVICEKDNFDEVLFCMEHTGIYCEHIFTLLEMYDINLWVESSLRIKKTMGMTRGKNDRIDAKRIALFSYRYQDKIRLWTPERSIIKRLKHLITFRTRTIETAKLLKMPLRELKDFLSVEEYTKLSSLHLNTLSALEADLKGINREIDTLIKEDIRLNYLFSIVSSVKNIGTMSAVLIIATTNEFLSINEGKKYACYAGVVPFQHQSGSSIRGKTRVSHIANKVVKTMLHMAALSAISRPGEFKDYFDRKVEEGKNKMSTVNAIRNKLVLRVFACVRDGKLYDSNYKY
jgi:transposase